MIEIPKEEVLFMREERSKSREIFIAKVLRTSTLTERLQDQDKNEGTPTIFPVTDLEEEETPEAILSRFEKSQQIYEGTINKTMDTLLGFATDTENYVLQLKYGLVLGKRHSLRETSQVLGIPKSTVWGRERRYLKKVQSFLHN